MRVNRIMLFRALAFLVISLATCSAVLRDLGETKLELGEASGVVEAVEGVVWASGEVDCELR